MDVEFARRLALNDPEALKEWHRQVMEQRDQARLDLANSDAIRAALVAQTAGLARDMVIALEMLETAYHAGYKLGAHDERVDSTSTLDASFRQWFKDAKVKLPKPGTA